MQENKNKNISKIKKENNKGQKRNLIRKRNRNENMKGKTEDKRKKTYRKIKIIINIERKSKN